MNDYNNSQDYADEQEHIAIKVLKVIGYILIGIVVVIVFSFSIMLLWNWLIPSIFGLREITYWEGVGLLVLAKIFFSGFGSSSSSSSKKDEKKQRGPIKEAIYQEVHEEMQREFKNEYAEKYGETTTEPIADEPLTNEDQEALYDQWWEQEGEKRFEAFMKK